MRRSVRQERPTHPVSSRRAPARHQCRARDPRRAPRLGHLDRDDAAVAPDVEDLLALEPRGGDEGEALVWGRDGPEGDDAPAAGVVAPEVAVRGRGALALLAAGGALVRLVVVGARRGVVVGERGESRRRRGLVQRGRGLAHGVEVGRSVEERGALPLGVRIGLVVRHDAVKVDEGRQRGEDGSEVGGIMCGGGATLATDACMRAFPGRTTRAARHVGNDIAGDGKGLRNVPTDDTTTARARTREHAHSPDKRPSPCPVWCTPPHRAHTAAPAQLWPKRGKKPPPLLPPDRPTDRSSCLELEATRLATATADL